MNLNKFSWILKKTLRYYTIFKPKNQNELKETVKYYCKNEKKVKDNLCLHSQVRGLKSTRFICTCFVCTRFACMNTWDVSNITDMSFMFFDATNFNQPLNNWDVSNVTDTAHMFNNAQNFNQPLNDWDVSNVTDTAYMFNNAQNFNQPLNDWDVSNITYMRYMFSKSGQIKLPQWFK